KEVEIIVPVESITVTTSPDDLYVTVGYSISSVTAAATIIPGTSSYDAANATWSVADTSIATYDSSSKVIKGVKVGTTNLTATLAKSDKNGNDVSGTAAINVYELPTITYSSTTNTVAIDVPGAVRTDKDDISSVKSGYVKFVYGGNTLGGFNIEDGGSVSSTRLLSLINSNQDKFKSSGNDIETVMAYVYPQATTSGTTETSLYASAEIPVYKINVTGDNITGTITGSGTTTNSSYYALNGQSLTLKATPASGYKIKYWDDDNSITSGTRTVAVSGARTYKAITTSSSTSSSSSSSSRTSSSKSSSSTAKTTAGTGTTARTSGGGSGSGLDSVPRTGESKAIYGIFLLMLLSAAGAVFYAVRIAKPVTAVAGTDSREGAASGFDADSDSFAEDTDMETGYASASDDAETDMEEDTADTEAEEAKVEETSDNKENEGEVIEEDDYDWKY
ncbi:MAG: hypothetical protein K6B28_03990, partial [Lachnospiraceae bacterium]|nr:hypothetical protein [Lachnospiraceae bacterium]